MTQKSLYRSLDANLALLEEMFGRSDDFYTKRLMLAGIPCAIVMFTGLSSPEKLCHMALDMLDRDPAMLGGGEGLCDYLLTQSRVPAEPDAVEDRTALVELLSNGLSVLLIDGVRRGVAFSTQEMPQRSISTPMSEGNLRGPQEAFTELLRNNISLLRRQFRTGTLVAEISTARTRAKTEYCLCYDSTLASKETIDALRERLEQVEIPVLLDSAYFASFLKQDKLNLFPAAAYTERPATACARLCEGKAVVLVAGCPYALIVPSFCRALRVPRRLRLGRSVCRTYPYFKISRLPAGRVRAGALRHGRGLCAGDHPYPAFDQAGTGRGIHAAAANAGNALRNAAFRNRPRGRAACAAVYQPHGQPGRRAHHRRDRCQRGHRQRAGFNDGRCGDDCHAGCAVAV